MKGAEAKMTAKAYCGRVITEWLAHTLIQATSGPLRGDEATRLLCVTVMLGMHMHSWCACEVPYMVENC